MMEQDNIQEIKKKAERFESQCIKLKQEFKDYIEASRKNEENKRLEMKIDLAKRLLVVADSLNRISELKNNTYCDVVKNYSENLKRNIDVIYSQMLSASGLAQIDLSVGDKFDEKMHIAVGLEYSTTYPENSVFRVIRKGYRIGDNVVRPSEVIVSKRPVEVKLIKPGLFDRFLRWISPAKFRFAEINQKIDELERIHEEKLEKLAYDMNSMKNTIAEHEKKIGLQASALSQHSDVFDDENYSNIKEGENVG